MHFDECGEPGKSLGISWRDHDWVSVLRWLGVGRGGGGGGRRGDLGDRE